MSRPLRRRRIRNYPDCWSFSPDEAKSPDCVTLTLDEYETVRLLDREALTQEQCAVRMELDAQPSLPFTNAPEKR